MRIIELLVEGYSDQLVSDLTDLLATAKGKGLRTLNTPELVSQLKSLGHNVNINSIMTILSGNPFIQTATPTQLVLKTDDGAGVSGDADAASANKERVSQLAQQTAKSDILK